MSGGYIKDYIKGGNPYLPLWEHIPDGEPRVFTHNGETRVYIYGSHDSLRTKYCGEDYVVWSAPVDNLNDWRFDGEIYRGKPGNVLYAPDVVQKGDTYYLYIAMYEGNQVWVAESKSPVGPFENLRKTDFGFDIGVLVDDDGRCYAYWGFKKCFACEMNEDMATIKEGTLRTNMIPHCAFRDNVWDTDNIDNEFGYFEAASIRKVEGKYVFVYSKRDMEGNAKIGRKPNVNSYLDYAYSDSPLDGWVHGGTISNNAGDTIWQGDDFKSAYMKCNNHGSICEINGQWYVFYHRRTGTNEFARQAMLEPIEVALGQNGQVFIGEITYDAAGEPVSCREVEMTSQGAYVNGLPADCMISAGRAVYIDSFEQDNQTYILPVYDTNNQSAPIVNIRKKTIVGFKYIDLQGKDWAKIIMRVKAEGDMTVSVHLDSPDTSAVARGTVFACADYQLIELALPIQDADSLEKASLKRAIYFEFELPEGAASFDWFSFEACAR